MTTALTRDQVLHAVEALAMCGHKAAKCQRLQRTLDGIDNGHLPAYNGDSREISEHLRSARTDLVNKVDATDSFFVAPARVAAQSAEIVAEQNPAIGAVVAALASFGIEDMVAASGTLIGFAETYTVSVVPRGDQVEVHAIRCDRHGGVFTAGSASGPGAVLDDILSDAFARASS